MLTLSALLRRSFAFGVTGALAAIFTLNAAAAITLVTPQMRLAQVGEVFVDNLTVTSTSAFATVNVTGLPVGVTATQNGKGDIAFTGTPTVEGNYAIAIAVSNASGESQTFATKLVVYGVLSGVTQIAGGGERGGNPFYCAVVDGGVRCWGSNRDGKIGNGTSTLAIAAEHVIAPKSGVTQIAVGGNFACAVIKAGVQCWGKQSADLPTNDGKIRSSRPLQVIPFGSDVVDVSVTAVGGEACAVVAGGVRCWAVSTGLEAPSLPDVKREGLYNLFERVPAGSGVTKLRVGETMTCALLNGTIRCWGGRSPVVSDGPTQVIEDVAIGKEQFNYFCIAANGGVRCQNDFSANELGIPADQFYQVIPEKSGVSQLFASTHGACTLLDGALWCWGYLAQLPFGSKVPIVARPASENITDMAFTRTSVCIVKNGKPRCYGRVADNIELGNRSNSINANLSPVIAAGSDIVDAAIINGHACAVRNGGVFCSARGELGVTPFLDRVGMEAIIAEGNSVTKLAMSVERLGSKLFGKYCAVVDAGVQCWEDVASATMDAAPQASISRTAVMQMIPSRSDVTAVSVSPSHSCALVDGGLQCWGSELGLTVMNRDALDREGGATSLERSPRWIFGFGRDVTAVVTGPGYTCAVKLGGVYCWGNNAYFSFNNGERVASARAVEVVNPREGVKALSDYFDPPGNYGEALGASSATQKEVPYEGNRICALKANGEVLCWGGSFLSNCGFGYKPCAGGERLSRVVVPAGSGLESIMNSCGIGSSLLKCWNILSPSAVAASAVGVGITTLVRVDNPYGRSANLGQTWPCAITSGGLSCFFADGVFPRPVSTEYFAATSVSTLPDDTPNRKPWYRVVGVPDEMFVLTNNPAEYAALVVDKMRYVAQGYVFSVPNKASIVNGITAWPLYRLYREDSKLPIWTTNFAEYQAMRTNPAVFRDDGIDGYVYKQAGVAGTVPLYRFKRRGSVQELLVTNPNEVQYLRNASHWELLRDVDGNSDAIGYVWPAQ